MLQNKLLTFCFELKLQVRRMEIISLTEIFRLLASCCAVVISTPIMGRIRASCQPWGRCREAYDLVNERAPSGLCMCPFYCVCQKACAFRLVNVSVFLWSGNGQVRMFVKLLLESLLSHVYGPFVERRNS